MYEFNEAQSNDILPLALSDPRIELTTIYTSWTGIIITAVSSSISAASSSLVIYVIWVSPKRLSTVYHRILFGMSMFDIMQSLSMALTTLPMPTDMVYDQFQGLIVGNFASCNAQGFFISLGTTGGIAFNVILLLYYVSSIRYNRTDDWFRNHLEVTLYSVMVILCSSHASVAWFTGAYHPSPVASPWCSLCPYPWWCSSGGSDCVQPNTRVMKFFNTFFLTVLAPAIFLIIATSLILIMRTVQTQTKDFLSQSQMMQLGDNEEEPASQQYPDLGPPLRSAGTRSRNLIADVQHRIIKSKRYLLKQALAYSFINVFNFIILVVFPPIRNEIMREKIMPAWWQIVYVSVRPLQGLFNFIIFMHHKIYNLRRNQSDLSIFDALVMSLKGKEAPVRILSELTMVREHDQMVATNAGEEEELFTLSSANDTKDEAGDNISVHSVDCSSLTISQESLPRGIVRSGLTVRSRLGDTQRLVMRDEGRNQPPPQSCRQTA